MAIAIDVGTSFLVVAREVKSQIEFKSQRDAYFTTDNDEIHRSMLDENEASYIEHGDKLLVLGEDALKTSVLSGDSENLHRPMASGVINPGEEESSSVLQVLVKEMLGPPLHPNEICAVTVPANPVDLDSTTTYHEAILRRCVESLGYTFTPINEAVATVYSENPKAGGRNFSGIGVSWGGGMVNLATVWGGKPLLQISTSKSGDWIDRQTAMVRNEKIAKVTLTKERKLDLSGGPQADRLLEALFIFYEDAIRYSINALASEMAISSISIDEPLEVVIAGGTAAVPGFIELFRTQLDKTPFPIPVSNVRLAESLLTAPAHGALIAATRAERSQNKIILPEGT